MPARPAARTVLQSRRQGDTGGTDAESAWKRVLQALLPDFLALAHPALHAAIDWTQPPAFLDKELQAITRQGRKGRRAVDLLASVRRRDGQEQWLLVHIEVQADRRDDFARRMFVYHARLVDRYDRPVVSMAVLSDERAAWRPATYAHDHWGCRVTFHYPLLKVLDWRGREEELARLPNPFAQVLLAQLAVLTTRGQVEPLAATQLAILRRLARAGYTYEQIDAVLTFLDGVIALPDEVEARVDAELAESEGMTMPQLLSRWTAEALEIRALRAQQELILSQLEQQCGPLSDETATRIRVLATEELADLGRALLRFASLADLNAWLAAHPAAR